MTQTHYKFKEYEVKSYGGVTVKWDKLLADENGDLITDPQGNPINTGTHAGTIMPGETEKLDEWLPAKTTEAIKQDIWTQEVINNWQTKNA